MRAQAWLFWQLFWQMIALHSCSMIQLFLPLALFLLVGFKEQIVWETAGANAPWVLTSISLWASVINTLTNSWMQHYLQSSSSELPISNTSFQISLSSVVTCFLILSMSLRKEDRSLPIQLCLQSRCVYLLLPYTCSLYSEKQVLPNLDTYLRIKTLELKLYSCLHCSF